MKKKRFRIKKNERGFLTYYSAQVKTWLGWLTFSAFIFTGNIYYIATDGTVDIKDCQRYIEVYCLLKGIPKDSIEITYT